MNLCLTLIGQTQLSWKLEGPQSDDDPSTAEDRSRPAVFVDVGVGRWCHQARRKLARGRAVSTCGDLCPAGHYLVGFSPRPILSGGVGLSEGTRRRNRLSGEERASDGATTGPRQRASRSQTRHVRSAPWLRADSDLAQRRSSGSQRSTRLLRRQRPIHDHVNGPLTCVEWRDSRARSERSPGRCTPPPPTVGRVALEIISFG